MDFHATVPVSQVLGSALSILRNARDLAKDSDDRELKEVVGQVFDVFSSLKERMLSMEEEIASLKSQLAKKVAITGPMPPFGYFYKSGDTDHPLCPKCYQEKGYEYMLSIERFNGAVNRVCQCGWSTEEVPAQATGQTRIGRMSGRR
jgi:hypothetical protein